MHVRLTRSSTKGPEIWRFDHPADADELTTNDTLVLLLTNLVPVAHLVVISWIAPMPHTHTHAALCYVLPVPTT